MWTRKRKIGMWTRLCCVYINRHRDIGAIDFKHLVMDMEHNTKHAHCETQTVDSREENTVMLFLSFFLGFRRPNLITELSGW